MIKLKTPIVIVFTKMISKTMIVTFVANGITLLRLNDFILNYSPLRINASGELPRFSKRHSKVYHHLNSIIDEIIA